jgi:hypothetical protein
MGMGGMEYFAMEAGLTTGPATIRGKGMLIVAELIAQDKTLKV